MKSSRSGSRSQAFRHRVRDGIEHMILTGELRPGERLVQENLASQFEVAQGVVRESLLELSCTGLVNAVDNLGVFVGELGGDKVLEAFEVREVLEGLSARLCCRRASRDHIEELRQLAEQVRALGAAGKTDEASQMDQAFHRRIVEIAGNNSLLAVTNSHWTLRLILKMTSDVEVVSRAHSRIIDAIAENHPELAEQRMREHVRSARDTVEQNIAAGEFLPEWLTTRRETE